MKNAEKDLQLVQEYLNGNENSFTELFNRYFKAITFKFVKSGCSHHVAKDLAIHTFSKVASNIRQYSNSQGAFSTWLYMIARNTHIDHLRKTTNNSLYNIEDMSTESDDGSFEFQIDSGELNPEDLINRKQRAKYVHSLIETIKNENAREIIKLRYIHELSYEEISEKLDTPIGTVKGSIFRAKEEMKRNFRKKAVV